MHTTTHTHAIVARRRRLLRLLLMVAILFTSALALVSNTLVSRAASTPGGNVADPFVRAVDIAKPAIVRILTQENSTLAVRFSATSTVTFPQNNAPGYPLTLSGSGAFISANGDILTADHVVNPPQDDSMKQYLDLYAAQDVADYLNKTGSTQVTAAQVQQELDSGQLASTATYGKPTSEAYLSTDYTGPQSAPDINSVPSSMHATITIEQQSSFEQKDVAIVHAPFTDTPSVQVGDSSTVQVQDELRIIGFPGNGDVSGNNVPNDFFTLSVNQVFVSSVNKQTDSGAPVIQVGGNVEHGDSGGPALDSDGKIVGIVSFGLVSNGEPGSTSFLQASNSGRDLIQSLNLNTTPGAFQSLWNKAFTEYAVSGPQHWHKAESDFQQLASTYPLFKSVTPYLTYATTQAASEATPTPTGQKGTSGTTGTQTAQSSSPFTSVLLTVGILLVLAFLVVLFFAVGLRRRGKKPDPGKPLSMGGMPQAVPQTPVPAQQMRASVVPPGPQPNRAAPPTPLPPVQRPAGPEDGMAAFGAPVLGSLAPSSNTTISMPLRAWPCGHMNRSNARFCSICGEPGLTKQVEQ